MTNKEIYLKAIDKINSDKEKELYISKLIVNRRYMYVFEIYYNIFSHEFAKAFWGEKEPWIFYGYNENGSPLYESPWQYHLQQMVLEKEPLKYLERFL